MTLPFDSYSISDDIVVFSNAGRQNSIDCFEYEEGERGIDEFDIVVYDKAKDSILWHFVDEETFILDGSKSYIPIQEIGIDGDFLFYATTYQFPITFMGDSMTHLEPDYLGIQYSTKLHKINWTTGERLWSKRLDGNVRPEKVREIKVVDDGSIMIAMETNGPLLYDGEVYDPPHMQNFGIYGSDIYNMLFLKIDKEGNYINHQHIKTINDKAVREVQIEDSGVVYGYGAGRFGKELVVGEDTISFPDDAHNGFFLKFDKDLNLEYYKFFPGNDLTAVWSANSIGENTVINVHLDDSLFLASDTIVNQYTDQVSLTETHQWLSLIHI